jgi:hypothetical protein
MPEIRISIIELSENEIQTILKDAKFSRLKPESCTNCGNKKDFKRRLFQAKGIPKDMQLQIFLTGVSCVGKTTIGGKIGGFLGIKFFDLDQQIEKFFGTSIERLRKEGYLLFPQELPAGQPACRLT